MMEPQSLIFGPKSGEWRGVLVMERLYVGSKSEGDYPLLKAEDGQSYRLQLKSESDNLIGVNHWIGCHLLITGITDRIRGFRRIVTTMNDIQVIEPSEDAAHPDKAALKNDKPDGNNS